MAKALRHWEQNRNLQKRQCNCLILMTPKMKKLKKFTLGRNLESLSNADMTSIVGGSASEWHYFLGCSWQQNPFYVVKDCSDQTRMAYCNTIENTYCVAAETM